MKHSTGFNLAIAATVLIFSCAEHAIAGQTPAVVELFTSQGCSSCPPANENLLRLSNDPAVLALSFSVTYWDYLGWKDIFGKKEFTDRQVTYEPALGQSGPFTPQMVINGRQSTVGYDLAEIRRIIASEPALSGPHIALSGNIAVIDAAGAVVAPADVWLVRYDQGIVQVPVARGENAGETLPHAHVVRGLQHLGSWDGKKVTLPIPAANGGLKTAIIVQEPDGGRILNAATD
jgi:hypothetical protein